MWYWKMKTINHWLLHRLNDSSILPQYSERFNSFQVKLTKGCVKVTLQKKLLTTVHTRRESITRNFRFKPYRKYRNSLKRWNEVKINLNRTENFPFSGNRLMPGTYHSFKHFWREGKYVNVLDAWIYGVNLGLTNANAFKLACLCVSSIGSPWSDDVLHFKVN